MNPADRDHPYATRGQLSSLPWIKSMKPYPHVHYWKSGRSWSVSARYRNGRHRYLSTGYNTRSIARHVAEGLAYAIKGTAVLGRPKPEKKR